MSTSRHIEHLSATKAKLDNQDSIDLFVAFLAGDVGPVLERIISVRVDAVAGEAIALEHQDFERRLRDIQAEMARQVASLERQAARAEQKGRQAALTEVTHAWQFKGWADALLPFPTVGLPALAVGQRVTEWLRARATSEGAS